MYKIGVVSGAQREPTNETNTNAVPNYFDVQHTTTNDKANTAAVDKISSALVANSLKELSELFGKSRVSDVLSPSSYTSPQFATESSSIGSQTMSQQKVVLR